MQYDPARDLDRISEYPDVRLVVKVTDSEEK